MQTFAERVVFVHAHPDDETLSTGGAIATVVKEGGTAVVLTCTPGDRGEVFPDVQRLLDATGMNIVDARGAELRTALQALGAEGRWLPRPGGGAYADSGMQWNEQGRAIPADQVSPNALTAAPLDEVAAAIVEQLRMIGATAVVTYDQDGGYGHPDHRRVHEATLLAADALEIPVFLNTSEPSDITVDRAGVGAQVGAALQAYRSQFRIRGESITHVGGQNERLQQFEHYRRLHVEAPPNRQSQIVSAVLAGILGLVIGLVGTINHQGLMPWGLVLSLVAAVGLVIGARAATQSKWIVAGAVIGLLGTISFFLVDPVSGQGFGSQFGLIPNNIPGWLWAIVPFATSLVVLAWPGRNRRSNRLKTKPTEGKSQ
ncbi:PIG-L family deacetylase [Humidisolicoccus flavus]|uniref:PIG-L family deacetylase n=1 Tax=Humidisolicoccus flavus TaxID=3111414 RepID=UPI00324E3DDD